MTLHRERLDDGQLIERCDHEGTTGPLDGLAAVNVCSACGKTWPARFGAGAATVRIVPADESDDQADGRDKQQLRGLRAD